MKPINTNDAFKETIQSDNPVIVKFEAGWCPDCKAMDMWIDPIQEKYNDYGWFTVNRDELEDVAAENDVMGIPSLLVFKNGEKLAHLHSANAKSPDQVESFNSSSKSVKYNKPTNFSSSLTPKSSLISGVKIYAGDFQHVPIPASCNNSIKF